MKGRKHILVVEDERHIGTLVKYNLEAEGYRVTLVEDGPTALKLLRADPYAFDLIILDLMLPGMSGYAVCETLRNEKVMVPVLILMPEACPKIEREDSIAERISISPNRSIWMSFWHGPRI